MPSEIADRGPADALVAALDPDDAGVELVDAGDRPGQLGAPRAEQAGDAEHLALDQVDVGASLMPDPTLTERALRKGWSRVVGDVQPGAGAQRVGAAAEHRLDQVDPEELAGEVLADQLAVAQHGHPVADLVDLVEEVRDEDDRDAALLEVADHAEQLGALVQVQARRRLVEHQHADVGGDRPRDGHQLLHGERVPARGSRRGRCRGRGRRARRARARASAASRSARTGAARSRARCSPRPRCSGAGRSPGRPPGPRPPGRRAASRSCTCARPAAARRRTAGARR